MSGKSFIPPKDHEFDGWQINFFTKVNLFKIGWNWSEEADDEWTLLTNTALVKKKRWDAAWLIIASGDFKPSQDLEKNLARQDYESGDRKNVADTSLRIFIGRHISNNPLVTEVQKREMGLLISGVVLSAPEGPNSMKAPLLLRGTVRDTTLKVHVSEVRYNEEKSKAKPDGVKDIQIFMIITEASVQVAPATDDFKYDGVTRGGLYKHTFAASQQGKRAWYFARFMYKGKLATYGMPSDPWDAVIS